MRCAVLELKIEICYANFNFITNNILKLLTPIDLCDIIYIVRRYIER